jgi:hypothetical protein
MPTAFGFDSPAREKVMGFGVPRPQRVQGRALAFLSRRRAKPQDRRYYRLQRSPQPWQGLGGASLSREARKSW